MLIMVKKCSVLKLYDQKPSGYGSNLRPGETIIAAKRGLSH